MGGPGWKPPPRRGPRHDRQLHASAAAGRPKNTGTAARLCAAPTGLGRTSASAVPGGGPPPAAVEKNAAAERPAPPPPPRGAAPPPPGAGTPARAAPPRPARGNPP